MATASEKLLHPRRHAVLQSLTFQRPDYAKADSAGNKASQMLEEEKAAGGIEVYFEGTRDKTKDGSQMIKLRFVTHRGEIC